MILQLMDRIVSSRGYVHSVRSARGQENLTVKGEKQPRWEDVLVKARQGGTRQECDCNNDLHDEDKRNGANDREDWNGVSLTKSLN